MLSGIVAGVLSSVLIFGASPTSTNYALPSYQIGSGGTSSSTSTNYKLNGVAGTQTSSQLSSTSYKLSSGYNPTLNANVPAAPTLSNPASYYNKLQLVIDTGGNPSDTTYLIAISPDNFTTTYYVQPDNSISASYTITAYRTYASYGSGSGFLILGLLPNTTYTVRVKAMRGNFTESAYSPDSNAVATVGQTLSFGLSTTLTATPPFTASFSSLAAGSVFAANADIDIALTTNANLGGSVYVRSSNAALVSSAASYSISSATADLAAAQSGYGAQVVSATQSSGGPFVSVSPFDNTADNVGMLSTTLQEFLTTTSPIIGATSTMRLKAKADSLTPSSSDYTDTLTVVAAMNY